MEIAVWLVAAAVLFLLGNGVCRCIYGREYRKTTGGGESCLYGLCALIGVTEAAHLAGVFLHWELKRVALLLWAVAGMLSAVSALWLFVERLREKKTAESAPKKNAKETAAGIWSKRREASVWLAALFGLSVLLQIIVIVTQDAYYRDGNMTLETVQSFLAHDGIYTVNPLTGRPYEAGMPLRLKILSLPTLHASVGALTGLAGSWVVTRMWPVVVLILAYIAWNALGRLIYREDKSRRYLWLLLLSFLIWMGDYAVPIDSFQLLHCGGEGTAVRIVLVVFALEQAMQRRWLGAALAVLAEACVVWTLYGMGVSFSAVVLTLIIVLVRKYSEKKDAGIHAGDK